MTDEPSNAVRQQHREIIQRALLVNCEHGALAGQQVRHCQIHRITNIDNYDLEAGRYCGQRTDRGRPSRSERLPNVFRSESVFADNTDSRCDS